MPPPQPPRAPLQDPYDDSGDREDKLPPPPQVALEFQLSLQLERQLGEVKTVGPLWFVYKKETGCWIQDDSCVYRPMAMSLIPVGKRTDRLAKSVVANLESRKQVADTTFHGAVKFESHNVVLINTRTCVVRVAPTGTAISTLPHDPKHGFTCALNVTYDPAATCPRFDRTLIESLPDSQDQMLLLNFFGYTLLPDVRFQVTLVCIGVTGSGKSTLMQPLNKLFEHESLMTGFPIESICTGKDYCLAHFEYALVNVCGELTSTEVTESANFKSIVAGDVLQARGIYGKASRLRSICKLIFLANSHPRFKNGTPAEARRLAFLNFCNPPKEMDNALWPALHAEVPGVFAHMLARLQALLTMSSMPQGGAGSKSVLETFRLSNSPIETFVERHCDIHPDHSESNTRLKEVFADFVYTHGLNEGLNKSFLKRLREKFPMLSPYRKGHADRTCCLRGIKLKPNVADVLDMAPPKPYDGD